MHGALKKIGNSAGVIIPKPLLSEMGVQAGDNVDLRVERGRLVIEPVGRNPREGWAEDAKRLAEAGDDKLVWPEFIDDDLDEEWTW